MGNRFIRILAVAMLLALATGMLPATAEPAKRSIVADPMYVNSGAYRLNIKNWTREETVISLKSSRPDIIEVQDEEQRRVIPKKVGKSKITLRYELDGKKYTISRTLNVQKYPNAIKSLTINGKKVALKGEKRVSFCVEGMMDDKPIYVTINLKPNTGWTYTVKGYKYDMENPSERSKLTVRNNRRLKIPKDCYGKVIYTLKNRKGKTFQYTIDIDRFGE